MDHELAAIDDSFLYGRPIYYRAAIAAWLGHREQALGLLRAARAAGWSQFFCSTMGSGCCSSRSRAWGSTRGC